MEQTKRSLTNDFNHDDDDDNKQKQKIQSTTTELPFLHKSNVTCLEDLANELIYEIFTYLDCFHVYQVFSPLNRRFSKLFTYSNLSMRINLPIMSKSTFKRYNEDIISRNIHQIRAFHFSNVFIYDYFSSSFFTLSDFKQIQTLVLHQDIDNCRLDQLSSLSLLSSLTISFHGESRNTDILYRQIFRLSTLKYCKLFFDNNRSNGPTLPICENDYSFLENFISNVTVDLDQLNNLLSYVPHLRRLSLSLSNLSWDIPSNISSISITNLTHISLKLSALKFDQLLQLIMYSFRNVQVLSIREASSYLNAAYLDAKKWEQVIISYIPKLRSFTLQMNGCLSRWDNKISVESKMNQFKSSFWFDRHWFFDYEFYEANNRHYLTFGSTNPNRHGTCLYDSQISLYSNQYVCIDQERTMINCKNYFPYATELSFDDDFQLYDHSLATVLGCMVPLKQLTKLVFNFQCFSMEKVIKILSCTPNIHTIKFITKVDHMKGKNDYTLLENDEDFKLISNRHMITNVIFEDSCTFDGIELFVSLCCRIKYLSMNIITDEDPEPIIEFLLDKINKNTRHLCLLSFTNMTGTQIYSVKNLLNDKKLLNNYTCEFSGRSCYFWW